MSSLEKGFTVGFAVLGLCGLTFLSFQAWYMNKSLEAAIAQNELTTDELRGIRSELKLVFADTEARLARHSNELSALGVRIDDEERASVTVYKKLIAVSTDFERELSDQNARLSLLDTRLTGEESLNASMKSDLDRTVQLLDPLQAIIKREGALIFLPKD